MWQTVMALPNSCPTCERVPFWSNPNVNFPPTGQPMGTNEYENNAQVLNETSYNVRQFRTIPPPLNFSIPNAYNIGENPHLEWDAVMGEDVFYRIERCVTDPGAACQSFQWEFRWDVADPQTWCDDTSVTIESNPWEPHGNECDFQKYNLHYRVKAQNFTGLSDPSNIKSICGEQPLY